MAGGILCHCEERSDEAISYANGIAHASLAMTTPDANVRSDRRVALPFPLF